MIYKLQMSINIFEKEYNLDIQKIDLTDINIEKIPSEIQFLIQLTQLFLDNNKIKEIPQEIQFLTQLTYMSLRNNEINEIPKEIQFLIQLTELDLSFNLIKEIPKEIQFLTQLTIFDLKYNEIKEIPKEIQFLIQLTHLFLHMNQIKEISKEIQFLTQLTYLHLSNNRIKELPLEIINLRNLIIFTYYNNPIENLLNLIINRFLKRIENKNKQIYNIHNDTQNVHSSSIQQSIKESIFNLLKQLKGPYKYNYFDDSILTQQTKEQLIEYSNCTNIHTQLECTFEELLNAVFYEIQFYDSEKQISAKKRINEEMLDGLCMCFTGRMSRLVNSLSGLSEKVSIKISENEEISNIIILANKKYRKIKEIKDYVKKEMKERLYNDSIIEEWLSYID
jgi:Leucine-rich repeat (LRR) protein